MSKTKLLLAMCSTTMLLGACALTSGPDDPDVEQASLGETSSAIVADPICGTLHDVYVEAPVSCNLYGQLGTKTCHQSCTYYRHPVLAFPGQTCEVSRSECTPWECGPCMVYGPASP